MDPQSFIVGLMAGITVFGGGILIAMVLLERPRYGLGCWPRLRSSGRFRLRFARQRLRQWSSREWLDADEPSPAPKDGSGAHAAPPGEAASARLGTKARQQSLKPAAAHGAAGQAHAQPIRLDPLNWGAPGKALQVPTLPFPGFSPIPSQSSSL
jgi:hypothetical protein